MNKASDKALSAVNTINYIECPTKDLVATKHFFQQAFDWQFIDYGDHYSAFDGKIAGINGGFYTSDHLTARTETGSVLVVLYVIALESAVEKVITAGGTISQPIFAFPGGRRFHFLEPSGNEFAVWSDGV